MKISISLPTRDVEFLDVYMTEHDLKTRSAALQSALRTLRDLELEDSYAEAFQEKEDPAVLAEWHRMWVEGGGPLFPDADKPR